MARKTFNSEPRGFFRSGLALWRTMHDRIGGDVEEAAIVQFAFNRSKWGKKVARWDLLAAEVAENSPEAAQLMAQRASVGVIDLQELIKLPVGTLGHTYAKVSLDRGIEPVALEPISQEEDGDWLMTWAYETHDIWHVMTGNYYDEVGEFGVAGFYLGQMPRFTFVLFFSSLMMLRTVWRDRDEMESRMQAFVDGYERGSRAKNLMGLNWTESFHRDLEELRAEWGIEDAGRIQGSENQAAFRPEFRVGALR